MASLGTIAFELQQQIAEHLSPEPLVAEAFPDINDVSENRRALKALCLTNHRLYDASFKSLYKNVILWRDNTLDRNGLVFFLRSLTENAHLRRSVKHISCFINLNESEEHEKFDELEISRSWNSLLGDGNFTVPAESLDVFRCASLVDEKGTLSKDVNGECVFRAITFFASRLESLIMQCPQSQNTIVSYLDHPFDTPYHILSAASGFNDERSPLGKLQTLRIQPDCDFMSHPRRPLPSLEVNESCLTLQTFNIAAALPHIRKLVLRKSAIKLDGLQSPEPKAYLNSVLSRGFADKLESLDIHGCFYLLHREPDSEIGSPGTTPCLASFSVLRELSIDIKLLFGKWPWQQTRQLQDMLPKSLEKLELYEVLIANPDDFSDDFWTQKYVDRMNEIFRNFANTVKYRCSRLKAFYWRTDLPRHSFFGGFPPFSPEQLDELLVEFKNAGIVFKQQEMTEHESWVKDVVLPLGCWDEDRRRFVHSDDM
ncbi:hypothetical protein F5B20DRAFT_577457 [Whalleya microplaca]|nr:hypothetical protein F5B20DRAFT_577457 [Whalleya microplaca]